MPLEQAMQALLRGLRPRSALGRVFTRATVRHMASQRQTLNGPPRVAPTATSGRLSPPKGTSASQAVVPEVAEDTSTWTQEVRNGYAYSLDQQQRPRRIQGRLVSNAAQTRNSAAQLAAGGHDRKTTDEGGHFIARRFNGPTEACNHFAQDRNFNRSKFKALENLWQRALDKQQQVVLDFKEIRYPQGSMRPSELRIDYTIDGVPYKVVFKNAPAPKP